MHSGSRQLRGFKSFGWYWICSETDGGSRKGRTESSCPLEKLAWKMYLSRSQIVFLQIVKCICPDSDAGSRNEGEKGKQLSVGETGALITEVGPLVSTKEPNFLGQNFNLFSRANCSFDPWLFGTTQESEIFGAANLIISMCNKFDPNKGRYLRQTLRRNKIQVGNFSSIYFAFALKLGLDWNQYLSWDHNLFCILRLCIFDKRKM